MVAGGPWVHPILRMILIIPWVPLRVTWDTQMVAALATNYRGLWDNTTSTPGFPTCTSYVREYNTEPRKGTERFEEGLTVDNQMTVSASAKQARNATHHKYGMQNINDAKEHSVTTWAPSTRTESSKEDSSMRAAEAVSRASASARVHIGRGENATSAFGRGGVSAWRRAFLSTAPPGALWARLSDRFTERAGRRRHHSRGARPAQGLLRRDDLRQHPHQLQILHPQAMAP